MINEKLEKARAQVGRCFHAKQLAEELEEVANRMIGEPILLDEKLGECVPSAHVLTPSRVAARFAKVLSKYGDVNRVRVTCDWARECMSNHVLLFLRASDGSSIKSVDDLLEELTP